MEIACLRGAASAKAGFMPQHVPLPSVRNDGLKNNLNLY